MPEQRRTTRPIILLGSGRSGTTILANIVARHPDVAYWSEPRPVWMYRHAYRPHHDLSAEDLTPAIARYIDRAFARFLERSGRRRFAEKTPSNCLRIPFIHALFPDCRIINIIRDGREVVGSLFRIQVEGANPERLWARIRETPLLEWPAYLPLFFHTFLKTKVLRQRSTYWGIKPEGWKEWIDLPPHIVAARQWKRAVEVSLRHGRALPSENYFELRYERLVADPAGAVTELTAFAELPDSPEMIEYAVREIDPSRAAKPKTNITDQQLREAVEEMEPLLSELGYGADPGPRTAEPGHGAVNKDGGRS